MTSHFKICKKCNISKPISEFSAHKTTKDRLNTSCKPCQSAYVISMHNKDRVAYRKYQSDYAKEVMKDPTKRKKRIAYIHDWLHADKRRPAAHQKVHRALKDGTLIKQPCERCGEERSVAHHENYDKPLEVWWLCDPCHKERHVEIKEAKKVEQDMVNNPSHYKVGGIETIDFIKAKLTPEEYRGYLKGSIFKYGSRIGYKDDPEKDVGKLGWFQRELLDFYKRMKQTKDRQ